MLSKIFYFSLAYVPDYPDYSFTFHRIRSYSVSQRANFWSLLKLLSSARMQSRYSISIYKSRLKLILIKRSTVAGRAVSESNFSMFDRCPTILIWVHTHKRNNQYVVLWSNLTRLSLASLYPIRFQNQHRQRFFKYHDSLSPTKNPKPIKSQDVYFRFTRRELFSSKIRLDSRPN